MSTRWGLAPQHSIPYHSIPYHIIWQLEFLSYHLIGFVGLKSVDNEHEHEWVSRSQACSLSMVGKVCVLLCCVLQVVDIPDALAREYLQAAGITVMSPMRRSPSVTASGAMAADTMRDSLPLPLITAESSGSGLGAPDRDSPASMQVSGVCAWVCMQVGCGCAWVGGLHAGGVWVCMGRRLPCRCVVCVRGCACRCVVWVCMGGRLPCRCGVCVHGCGGDFG